MATHTPKDILKRNLQSGTDDDVLAGIVRDSAKMVVLTQAAYDALTTKDPNTLYIVTA